MFSTVQFLHHFLRLLDFSPNQYLRTVLLVYTNTRIKSRTQLTKLKRKKQHIYCLIDMRGLYLSLFIHAYPHLSMFIHIQELRLFMFIHSYPYLPTFTHVHPCVYAHLSSINTYQHLYLSISIHTYHHLSISINVYHNIFISISFYPYPFTVSYQIHRLDPVLTCKNGSKDTNCIT